MRSQDPETLQLLENLQKACLQPLFIGITKGPESDRITWDEQMESASQCDCIDDDQHSQVMECAYILLLGFLLPYSTGNGRLWDAAHDELGDPMSDISLEFRLKYSVRYWDAAGFGEFDCLRDPTTELARNAFLKSLQHLLESRPAHSQNVDLWHIVAMGIHPLPNNSDDLFKRAVSSSSDADNPCWAKTTRLMQHAVSTQFQLGYVHRAQLAELLTHSVWPVLESVQDNLLSTAPLLSATAHLRASLRAFTSMSAKDKHVAERAVATIAVQLHHLPIMKEDFDYLLHQMVEDHSPCSCRGESGEPGCCRISSANKGKSPFCIHSSRGRLLASFILQSGRIRDTKDVDLFIPHALESLKDVLEWQTDTWVEEDDDKPEPLPSCVLSSLLYAANQLFYFQPAIPEELVDCGLQLLLHREAGIVEQAADLLVRIFYYAPKKSIDGYLSNLFGTLKRVVANKIEHVLYLRSLVALACRQSSSFTVSLYNFAREKDCQKSSQLVSIAAANCPVPLLENYLKHLTGRSMKGDELATLLSLRRAQVFVDKAYERTINESVESLHEEDGWTHYCLARFSILTGNFPAGQTLYRNLLGLSLCPKNHLWIACLDKVASCEAALCSEGEKGLSLASESIQDAMFYLQDMADQDLSESSFQAQFLALRCDFIDLVALIRQIVSEIRLLGQYPSKGTRSSRHFRRSMVCLAKLASDYRQLHRRHGLFFSSRMSVDALKICAQLVEFLKHATETAFVDCMLSGKPPESEDEERVPRKLDSLDGPVIFLMKRLNELVVQNIDESVELKVRASAMLEVIKGILLVPIPYPPDFFVPKRRARVVLHLSPDPNPYYNAHPALPGVVEALPHVSFSFIATGQIPQAVNDEARLPWYKVLLWSKISREPVSDTEEQKEGDAKPVTEGSQLPKINSSRPATSRVFADGKFRIEVLCPPIANEGQFLIEVKLGCQDVTGSQWELPVKKGSTTIPVRVQRIR